ncbi:LEAF RUST 10 DISEASE-RESISTANCE LOCUS RECEPTOR-LIKE PROTEIN KINASE-like 1.2 [Amaranthus tricolor]|uniref:LEAF RUST 10 DISEASE-RESISTANCE LOCUS RECEPTOR-LIKE PROTEIN KINASE-like 1.2 n=1 Tax=Amaranthus tricolor TaxID=29722 RepID=UPI00258A3CD7|nr:LEAF RUST 10 DISEASE-RESISTANCE LOCUS RECEPTOR-LIKE PROTEIN KINASE-like 1.2 [Amaranthus tricolor]
MYQINSFFLFISIFISIFPPSFSSNTHQIFNKCAPTKSSCGFQWKISYPFWDSTIPNYCGHPAFKLDCDSNSSLTINIKNQKYKIQNINYDDKLLIISNLGFDNGPCPSRRTHLVNSSLEDNLFNLSSNTQNATLFFDCHGSNLRSDLPYPFSCFGFGSESGSGRYGKGGFSSNVSFMAINRTWDEELRRICRFVVDIPILKTMAMELAYGELDLNDVFKKGFEVKWRIDDGGLCEDCLNIGGRCGFNYTLGQPTCFCENGAICKKLNATLNAPKDKRSNWGVFVLAGIGIGVCLLLSSLCLFIYRRKRKNGATKFLTHNKSYSPSTGGSNFDFLNGSTYFGVHVFTYRELEEATNHFNPSKELGEGGFGTVYHGKLRDGREVAIKRPYENNNKRAEQFLNEVEILATLRHKNLVNLYGCTSRQSSELLLVYEYVPNGTVADHLHGKQSKNGLLSWSKRLSIAIETASALVYLHDSDIIHRDVKTQNILLCNDFSVKVADFGLSRLFPLDVTHVSTAPQGTPGYVDPEYHQCYQLTEKSDVYSFGVLLAELISSLPAVDITRRRVDINLSNMAINKIQNHALHEFVDPSLGYQSDYQIKKEITEVAKLAFECLQSRKETRPTMNEVFKRLLVIQAKQGSEFDNAEEVDIPVDDVLMLKVDFSPSPPQREEYHLVTQYKPNASV